MLISDNFFKTRAHIGIVCYALNEIVHCNMVRQRSRNDLIANICGASRAGYKGTQSMELQKSEMDVRTNAYNWGRGSETLRPWPRLLFELARQPDPDHDYHMN